MTRDQAQRVMERIEVLILARLGDKDVLFDIAPDKLSGEQLNALFEAREDLRLALVEAN